MTAIASSSIFNADPTNILGASKQDQKAQSSDFDMLLSLVDSKETKNANSSSGATDSNNSLSGIFSVLMSESSGDSSGGFGLSSAFTDVFGDSGPLPDYINTITAALHLTPEQNQALQKIAIEHKDDAGSAGATQSIAAELTAAGITA